MKRDFNSLFNYNHRACHITLIKSVFKKINAIEVELDELLLSAKTCDDYKSTLLKTNQKMSYIFNVLYPSINQNYGEEVKIIR